MTYYSHQTSLCVSPYRMKRVKGDEDACSSSSEGPTESCKKVRKVQPSKEEEEEETDVDLCEFGFDWALLPQEILLNIFQFLPLLDRAYASQVCRGWNQAFHMPELWRCFEFELNQPASSYLKATHPDLIKQIIKRHSNHLQYVSFKVSGKDNSVFPLCPLIVAATPIFIFSG